MNKITVRLMISVSFLIGLTNSLIGQKQTFNKGEAINWLNTKIINAAKTSTVTNGTYTEVEALFKDCGFSKKLTVRKADYVKPLMGDKSPDAVEYYNYFSVDLSKLNPESATIHNYDNKFWVDIYTTNSTESVTKKIWYPNVPDNGTFYESKIRIGPFKPESNMQTRVVVVLKKLIISCGGKKEPF